jgi:rod shape-determining protein MreD
MMRPGKPLLLPAKPLFIWGSLGVALLLNIVQNMGLAGRVAWAPDLLALVLVFWTVHQPMRVSIGAAFVFGLLMDTHQGGLLGQHAFSYALLSYFAVSIHRRLMWFTVFAQAAQVLPLFVASHAMEVALRMLAGGSFPGPAIIIAPLIESALWPLASLVLLAPQRRAPNPDVHRPL